MSQNELVLELDELAEQYAILDELHQKALLEIKKYKESSQYGATFKFEDDNEIFIPIFGIVSGLKANGEKPVSYTFNFDESTMVRWIAQCDSTIGKNLE